LPTPEISPPNPDPVPESSSESFLKRSVSVQYRAYVYLFTLQSGSSIGIGKATRHHKFNNDEIVFCFVLGSVCPEKN
jgi:hypothetical protein